MRCAIVFNFDYFLTCERIENGVCRGSAAQALVFLNYMTFFFFYFNLKPMQYEKNVLFGVHTDKHRFCAMFKLTPDPGLLGAALGGAGQHLNKTK